MMFRKVIELHESSKSSQPGIKNEREPTEFEGVQYYVKILEISRTWVLCQRPKEAISPGSVGGKLGWEKLGSEESSNSPCLSTFSQRDALQQYVLNTLLPGAFRWWKDIGESNVGASSCSTQQRASQWSLVDVLNPWLPQWAGHTQAGSSMMPGLSSASFW